jgi:flagellar biosynthetic protein FlhB
VVITNPTHFAVALRYDRATMKAPQCVAKGQDRVAQRIREVAAENGVLMVENKLLARALQEREIEQDVRRALPRGREVIATCSPLAGARVVDRCG